LQRRNTSGAEFAKTSEQPLIGAITGDPEVIVGSVPANGLVLTNPINSRLVGNSEMGIFRW
jgi:hypothetical protein